MMRLPSTANVKIKDFTFFELRLPGWCQDDGVSSLQGQDDARMMPPPRVFPHASHSRGRMMPGWPQQKKQMQTQSLGTLCPHQWESMEIHENQWRSMKSNEMQWKTMQINENHKSMNSNDNWWESMKSNENHKNTWKFIIINENQWNTMQIN